MFHRSAPIALAALIAIAARADLGLAAPAGGAVPSPAPAAGGAAPAPIPVDSLMSADLRYFKLYGPDIPTLQSARHEMEYALNQFHRYIGDSPPKLTIAVLGTMADPSRVSAESLRESGVDYVVTDWPARPGAPPPATPVPELSERAARWFLLAFERAKAKAAPRAGQKRLVPDWFDSAIAGLCTSPVEQKRRLDWMSSHMNEHITIGTLLDMKRPEHSAGPEGKTGSAGGKKPSAKSGAKSASGAAPPVEPQTLFDAEALSFSRFLAMREGDRFIGWVLEPMLAGQPASAGLNRATTLFPRPDQLEAAWTAWVKGGMKNEAPPQE